MWLLFTNRMVDLPEPLMPHDSINPDIAWHYNLSTGAKAVRGYYRFNQLLYRLFLSLLISVMMIIKGGIRKLHMPGSLEFYNEFNDYNCKS